jgi:hypothetical protein
MKCDKCNNDVTLLVKVGREYTSGKSKMWTDGNWCLKCLDSWIEK